MRKYALPMVLASGMLATALSLPGQANALTTGAQLGILGASAPIQLEQAGGWCGGRRGCLKQPYYQRPLPYAYYSDRPL
jgi:hypothetical protein